MTLDAADRDPPPPRPSLFGRAIAGARARARRAQRETSEAAPGSPPWMIPTLALLIAAGPLATIAVAALLQHSVQRETAAEEAASAPRRAAAQGQAAARAILSAAIARPGPAAMLDALSPVLPADASLVRAEQREDGVIEFEVAVSDPDALRSALRRVPALARLRDVRQQESDGRTVVLLRQDRP